MGKIKQVYFSKTDIAEAIGISLHQLKTALRKNGYEKDYIAQRGSCYNDLEAFQMVKSVLKTASDSQIMQIIHPFWHQNEGI